MKTELKEHLPLIVFSFIALVCSVIGYHVFPEKSDRPLEAILALIIITIIFAALGFHVTKLFLKPIIGDDYKIEDDIE